MNVTQGILKAVKVTAEGFRTAAMRLMGEDVPSDMGTQLFQPYGLQAVPPTGSDALVFEANNSAESLIVIAGDRRIRIELESGDVAIHDNRGQAIIIKEGVIEIDGESIKLGPEADRAVARDSDVTYMTSRFLIDLNAAFASVSGTGAYTGTFTGYTGTLGSINASSTKVLSE